MSRQLVSVRAGKYLTDTNEIVMDLTDLVPSRLKKTSPGPPLKSELPDIAETTLMTRDSNEHFDLLHVRQRDLPSQGSFPYLE